MIVTRRNPVDHSAHTMRPCTRCGEPFLLVHGSKYCPACRRLLARVRRMRINERRALPWYLKTDV